jgi:hypothetical protein
MADNRIEVGGLVAEKDVEAGLLRVYADVGGQLVPIASEKLGLLGTHEVADSPSASKSPRSSKG